MEEILIAPCGMNCAVCSAYIAGSLDLKRHGIHRTYCPGCRPRGQNCVFMGHTCEKVGKGLIKYCYECETFPCARLKRLDKRYSKYNVSMIENLTVIKEQGMKAFLEKEETKWKCPECEEVVCCHTGVCYTCLVNQPKPKWKKIPPDKVTAVDLIAPCGMNCGVCSGYLAMKNEVKSKRVKAAYCHGCLPRGKGCSLNKSGGCRKLMELSVRFCYECDKFPCIANEHWDKIYRQRYNASPIENLEYIKANGIEKFLDQQREKWKCPKCGGVVSCHNGICYNCGLDKLKTNK